MTDAAKNVFHAALSANLRRHLRRFGLSLDEQAAQAVLGGARVVDGVPALAVIEAVDYTMTHRTRRALMTQWESEHPGRNPYPDPFPARVLTLVSRVFAAHAADDEVEVALLLAKLQQLCERELDTDDPATVSTEE